MTARDLQGPPTPDAIGTLYKQSFEKEKVIKQQRRSEDERIRDIIRWGISFGERRQFPAANTGSGLTIDELALEGQKYLVWLNQVRDAPDRVQRWFWIAQLLKDEGVAQPDQILPKDVFDQLTKEGTRRLRGFSWTAIRHADLVRCWLPYCEALLFDAIKCKELRGGTAEALKKLGHYDLPDLFPWSDTWHSPLPFTCLWLEMRGGVPMVKPRKETSPARTLENAYSRIYKGCCYSCGRRGAQRMKRDGVVLLRCHDHASDRR